MDSDEEGLNRTLELLEAYDIYSIGAGNKQINAENHSLFILIIKGI